MNCAPRLPREEEIMTLLEDQRWMTRLNRVDFAFQPIVNIHTGVCYGCEALLRNVEAAGFPSIEAFFDRAHGEKLLYPVDISLREMAVEKFARLEWKQQLKLFFNLDNRVLLSGKYRSGNTIDLLARYGLSQEAICFEISEKQDLQNDKEAVRTLDAYRSQGFKIAVDDCGAGFSGLKLLYYARPDFIKIDRFFIRDISTDPDKRLFVASIVNIAHMMGSIVIAEGVETEQEFHACRDIGCDLVQGFLIQRPDTDIRALCRIYPHIQALGRDDRRYNRGEDKKLLDTEILPLEPIPAACSVLDVFNRFKAQKDRTFFPVVNGNGEPLGIVSEKSFKDYIYSRYGNELLQNPAIGKNIAKFITKFPIAEINTPVEKILEIYSHNQNFEGILIVEGMKYKGFLSAHALLKVLNEKNIAIARDQNPLTKLPGNTLIHEYVSRALRDTENSHVLVYFDFDNFKPYNDCYGFRNGDRVILLFSDLLKSWTEYAGRFAGHIGGDDFFMGVSRSPLIKVKEDVIQLARQFRRDVESFYDPETIRRGCMTARGRDGKEAGFPLLTVSAVILHLSPNRKRIYSTEEISNIMARQKRVAKSSPEKINVLRLPGEGDDPPGRDGTLRALPSPARTAPPEP